ncbi:hypothetical protein ACFLV2_00450 [Chloroflexota bacterium]
MKENSGCCSDSGGSCGCRIDVFATEKKCHLCGGRLRLAGQAHKLELRLQCQGCGYAGPLLSQKEIDEVL